MNEITETSDDRLLNRYNNIKKEVTRKLDLISVSDYTKDFLLKNVKSLFGILTELSDEDIIELRELSAREVDSRAKKRINEYLNKTSLKE